jgi:tungstate transport system substrate-binding protein
MKWTATGTGKALKLGERCDADILLVHAPGAEKEFIDKGFGATRTEVMYNDFVIIGPDNDPAGIRGLPVIDALKKIKQQKTLFISRGDNSGTNKKEISLWKEVADSAPEKEKWYIQSGQGMLATINIASERGGYTLTDRGTYIKYEHTAGQSKTLSIQVEGGSPLKNQYSVVTLNKNNCPDTRHEFAEAFAKWIASPVAQRLIGEFRLLGKQLFTPNAQKS